ncbi:hypothetical protein GUJ93_ZPchr0009g643 [Zizania palustris]|uniref:Uncharacterized protein n=1 Tax=Zizania palustris TaxID=103762 RepID=A0A8J5VKG1_ZIZPA|nr:hypothetical protein GUJ93_ZPchr0009g643 [Zizania palustris]KAG8050418.1 hypothetical protein GUJ93_ZPchr0009g643 [Zizania palustris]
MDERAGRKRLCSLVRRKRESLKVGLSEWWRASSHPCRYCFSQNQRKLENASMLAFVMETLIKGPLRNHGNNGVMLDVNC